MRPLFVFRYFFDPNNFHNHDLRISRIAANFCASEEATDTGATVAATRRKISGIKTTKFLPQQAVALYLL
jgi:hypothetical protein